MSAAPVLSGFLTNDELNELLAVFPEVEFAFAYGSGAIEQEVKTRAQPDLSSQHSSSAARFPLRQLRSSGWDVHLCMYFYPRVHLLLSSSLHFPPAQCQIHRFNPCCPPLIKQSMVYGLVPLWLVWHVRSRGMLGTSQGQKSCLCSTLSSL